MVILMKEDFALSLMPLAPSNDLIENPHWVSQEMNYPLSHHKFKHVQARQNA
jgi:hypothetical protein